MMALLKLLQWLLYQLLANSFYRAMRKMVIRTSLPALQPSPLFPAVNKFDFCRKRPRSLVCDIQVLLRSPSLFPFFMLVAFEGGSFLRALLLLLCSPFLCVLRYETQLRVMIFVTFCGLRRRDMESVSRAVLPKFYLENLHFQAYRAFSSAGFKAVLTSVPRVMVEGFLKEYLGVDFFRGTELHSFGKFYTGLVLTPGLLVKHRALKECFQGHKPDVGLGVSSNLHDYFLLSLCKEAYVVNKEDMKTNPSSVIMPREKYPKPLIFHDGRLAFFPTPSASLSMFMWLPLGILLAIFRLSVGIFLPYKLAILLGTLSGVELQVKGITYQNPSSSSSASSPSGHQRTRKGVLFVCTHRTLLDPVFLSTALARPLTAVTYSLSKMSEFLAPIKTVRLTRDRKQDGEMMENLLKEGDLVVCPEGTTCREPYLLRFSSLFAELAEEIVPVAVNAEVGMFYGTTASGLKCLDPIFFLMNPRPKYQVQILEKLPREMTCAGGKSSFEVANHIQRQLADALGFQCTSFTRRDKYLMLAGNEGVVPQKTTRF